MLALRPITLFFAVSTPALTLGAAPINHPLAPLSGGVTNGSSSGATGPGAELDSGGDLAPIVIEAGRVIVRPGEELEEVKILVQDGLILAVGKDITAPADAQVVQAPVVCAAFLDGWTSVGIDRGSLAELSSSADTRTLDGWNPYDHSEARAEALRGGVTVARVQAAARASVGGVGAVVRLSAERDGQVVSEDACVAATIGVNRGGRRVDIFDRVGEVDRLVGLLGRAKSYDQSWIKYEAEFAEWEEAIKKKTAELEEDFKKAKKKRDKEIKEAEEKGKEHKEERYKEDKQPRRPKLDPDMATLARAVNGEVPLVVEVHRAEEIRALLNKTAEFPRLRLVIAGGTEAVALAATLKERDIPVICWPGPRSGEEEWSEHDLALAGRLEAAGVDVLIGSGGGGFPRELRMLAALAVGHGLSPEAALAAITTEAAAAFDLGAQLGAVERGKQAELVLLSSDPLDTTSRVIGVVTAGRLVQ